MFGFMFGFGYLSTTDEYKVVMGAEMFSSNKGSWKRIQVPPCSVGQSCGVFSSGALHWLLYSCDQKQQVPNLYAFDLEKEEFWMMKLPDALQTLGLVRSSISYQLGVTREGCLYVMVQSEVWDSGKLASFYVVDFWVMRDYDNSDSWTKSLGVKISNQPARRDWFLSIEAISVSETSAFVRNTYAAVEQGELMSTIYHRNEESSRMYILENGAQSMVVYEESYHVVLIQHEA
ncbi:PREDICTED: F-box protein CPR30-like [Fragaria vesca subsp. vesca]|uniref:F-box protein CPR30-like n=1 Tax=Fragaria vesca subsp. vesca TaxID=101020 RepID=UPI0002C34981|nr:PREDICTED: F-box protein CPR30-like [Fragaria vesca subsp. vesca]